MKWIKSRNQFLSEAKLREVIFPTQAKTVSKVWGEKYLDYEEVTPTNKIQQGKWKLSEEDKNKVLGKFFDCDMDSVFRVFSSLPDKFAEILAKSVDIEMIKDEKSKVIMNEDFNIKNPTIDQIIILFDPIFRKLSVSETQATEMIQKDENGRPVRDEDGNMIRIQKNAGDPIYSNNLVNINSFVDDFNRCFPDFRVNSSEFQNRDINSLRNLAKEDHNNQYRVDFEIFNKDVYLSITHNPKDILNMSISKFYASCQHLYSGGYREQVLGNVFDPNSIPAFLTFETPIFWGDDKISDQLPLSRMIIRNIETYDDAQEKKIFFDRAYPDRMKEVFNEIVEKYSENKQNVTESETYYFTPDIDTEDKIRDPYMDRLRVRRKPYIGKNTKVLYLSRLHDWSNVKIASDAKIKELVIETDSIPEDLSKVNINPDWIKFKYLTINSMAPFEKVKTSFIAFDKCKFKSSLMDELNKFNSNITKLQIISCDVLGEINLSQFRNLEELQLVYALDDISQLQDLTKNLNLKKLVISGDLIKDESSKDYVKSLRKSGKKVEIVGPVI